VTLSPIPFHLSALRSVSSFSLDFSPGIASV
jgi:hypothetical protein